jgi:hypothetical protein
VALSIIRKLNFFTAFDELDLCEGKLNGMLV